MSTTRSSSFSQSNQTHSSSSRMQQILSLPFITNLKIETNTKAESSKSSSSTLPLIIDQPDVTTDESDMHWDSKSNTPRTGVHFTQGTPRSKSDSELLKDEDGHPVHALTISL